MEKIYPPMQAYSCFPFRYSHLPSHDPFLLLYFVSDYDLHFFQLCCRMFLHLFDYFYILSVANVSSVVYNSIVKQVGGYDGK